MIKSLFGIRQIYAVLMSLIPVALYYISSGLLHFVSARYPTDETVMEGNNEVHFLIYFPQAALGHSIRKISFYNIIVYLNKCTCVYICK